MELQHSTVLQPQQPRARRRRLADGAAVRVGREGGSWAVVEEEAAKVFGGLHRPALSAEQPLEIADSAVTAASGSMYVSFFTTAVADATIADVSSSLSPLLP